MCCLHDLAVGVENLREGRVGRELLPLLPELCCGDVVVQSLRTSSSPEHYLGHYLSNEGYVTHDHLYPIISCLPDNLYLYRMIISRLLYLADYR